MGGVALRHLVVMCLNKLSCLCTVVDLCQVCECVGGGLHLAYNRSTHGLQLAYNWPTIGLHLAYNWPATGITIPEADESWPTFGLHLAYTWPTLGLQLAYNWPTTYTKEEYSGILKYGLPARSSRVAGEPSGT